MAGPTSEPDLWINWQDVAQVCEPADLSPAQQGLVLRAATNLMWKLSGRQFGVFSITARPMPYCGHSYGQPFSFWTYPGWASPPAQHWQPCSCQAYYFVHLGRAPINSITEVRVDGQVVDPATYHVDEWNYLVRADQPWPVCSDLASPHDHAGVFEVAWTYGPPVPAEGKTAAALLACRLSHEVDVEDDCAIPATASSVATEGVTIRLDLNSITEKGRTGILLVDLWLQSECPDGPQAVGDGFDPGGKREWFRTRT